MNRITLQMTALLGAFILSSACSESEFRSGAGGAARARTEQLALVCGANDELTTPPVFSGMRGTKVRVSGELCALRDTVIGDGQYHLNFILDFSGSMNSADPVANGSCGRLDAARAVINKMLLDSQNRVSAQVSVVRFDHQSSVLVQPTRIQDFAAQLNTNNFCGAVGATNYQAAFNSAYQLLASQEGTKLVYFITDGEPNVSTGTEQPGAFDTFEQRLQLAQRDSVTAATQLKSVANLTLNAIFTADPSGGLSANFDPKTFLTQLATSPDRVRVAADAQSLAAELQTLEVPKTTTIQRESIKASIVAEGLGTRPVRLETFEADPQRPGVWTFVTAPIELFGQAGRNVNNQLRLQVSDAQVPETTGIIVFFEER